MAEELDSNIKTGEELGTSGTGDGAPAPVAKVSAFKSLRIANYRWLLTGSVFSYACQWVQQVILSWLVYDITGSGTILGSITVVASVASLSMLLATGQLVDYFDRRKTMMIETGCIFAATFALGLVLVTGHSSIAYLFVFAFVAGLIQSLDTTLRQVIVFDIVPRPQIPSAMALIQTGWSLMRVLGPSIGGFLLIWFHAGGSFLIEAAAFALILLTVFQIKLPAREREGVQSSPLENIRVGLGYLAKERITRTFTLVGIIMPIIVIPIFSILPPIYAVQVFGDESGRILGFLMASVGVGGIFGGVAITYLRRLEHWGRLQLGSLFLLSLTLLAFAFSSSLIMALALLAQAGFFEIIFLTMNQTLIQLSISDNLRGRVTAVINLTWILSPVGSLIAGAGADLVGPVMITIILSCVAAAGVVVIFLISPTVRNYRLSQNIAAGN